MLWPLYVSIVQAVGWVCGQVGGPLLYLEREICRVWRWAAHGCAVGVGVLLSVSPLILAQHVTPQQFDHLEQRVRKVESVVERIDDPDGLLRTNARRLEVIDHRVSVQGVKLIENSALISGMKEKIDDLPKQLGLILGAFLAAFKLLEWVVPKIREVAGTDTGERRPVR